MSIGPYSPLKPERRADFNCLTLKRVVLPEILLILLYSSSVILCFFRKFVSVFEREPEKDLEWILEAD
jgi:hypothetical protein